MKKHIFAGTLSAILTAALLVSSVTAADIKFTTKSTAKAPVADGNITSAEYGGNAPIVFDGSGKNTESGNNANTTWATQNIKVYYTWDKANLYVGITVEGETTGDQAFKPLADQADTSCIWSQGDLVQLGFNPGMIIAGSQPLYFCVGFTADSEPIVHLDAFQNEADGKQTFYDRDDKIKGYSKKYSADGINYACELNIPWDKIFVKGANRSNQGAKVFDMTGEAAKLGDGYELPIMFLYKDKSGNTYRTAAKSTNYSWEAQDMFPLKLVLKDATPKASAATVDATSLAVFAALASAAAAAVVQRKRK